MFSASLDLQGIARHAVASVDSLRKRSLPTDGFGSTPADRRLLSDQPTFRQRHADALAHDDVIEKPDVDERERLLLCQGFHNAKENAESAQRAR
jgi:hypothetical protein